MPREIHKVCKLDVRWPDPETGKPFLDIEFGETKLSISLAIAEMIGGAARGAYLRFQDGNFKEPQ